MDKLILLRNNIERLDSSHHLEILRILKENNAMISENRNGVFLNLNSLPEKITNKLEEYVNHVEKQENRLLMDESIKKKYKDTFFNNDNEQHS